jgi:hypothetical protein
MRKRGTHARKTKEHLTFTEEDLRRAPATWQELRHDANGKMRAFRHLDVENEWRRGAGKMLIPSYTLPPDAVTHAHTFT